MPEYSIVEFFDENDGYKCGYCKSKTSAFSQGMWAHCMNTEDYQALIDRGWRRSGSYCYKPTMHKTCCPQYTIRCDANAFKISKSKKKVAKRMRQFLLNGGQEDLDKWKLHCDKNNNGETSMSVDEQPDSEHWAPVPANQSIKVGDVSTSNTETLPSEPTSSQFTCATQELPKEPNIVVGADPSKPPCKKAKQIRLERRKNKLLQQGKNPKVKCKQQQQAKSLNEFLPHLDSPVDAKHGLEVRLVRSSPPSVEFESSKVESHNLYTKYQTTIHKDKREDCNMKQWMRFLVDSPLNPGTEGPAHGYGSYHNQYWLDGKLVAVGVVDILPSCVSSVYLYYDPDYGFLSFGSYSAISEISFVQRLSITHPNIKYYYLGFYIQSCPKMRYKGAYHPSYLLCPESYEWVPVEKCEAALKEKPYARLNVLNGGSADAVDNDGIVTSLNTVRCLYKHTIILYGKYKMHRNREGNRTAENEDPRVREYAQLVGRSCAERMLLYRSSDF
uniref:arginyl-tRNA--protein transferase 1-like isoform X1 n=1 Tax=Ciona intestinalis TaxID=7719 RepID=UPI0002B8DA11|nr:arginyl-tRNA--protein transferase 1-like isoform X1 [Ciona intestinalis]|eukprot:XP_002120387.2 arginyl-tRNA--protein transferase 1-like isoform X1 [Ciona intestinalis]